MGIFSGITDIFKKVAAPVLSVAGSFLGVPPTWSGIAGSVGSTLLNNAGSIAQGVGSYYGSQSTNQANQSIAAATSAQNLQSAREATQATEGMAARAITSTEGQSARALQQSQSQFEQAQAFSERMSNSAFQRGVSDMRSAGLNPILAAGGGGASSPTSSPGPAPSGSGSGGAGTSAQAAQIAKLNEIGPALASAVQVKKIGQEIKQSKQAVSTSEASETGILANAGLTRANTRRVNLETDIMKRTSGSMLGRNWDALKNEVTGGLAKLEGINVSRLPQFGLGHKKGSGRTPQNTSRYGGASQNLDNLTDYIRGLILNQRGSSAKSLRR